MFRDQSIIFLQATEDFGDLGNPGAEKPIWWDPKGPNGWVSDQIEGIVCGVLRFWGFTCGAARGIVSAPLTLPVPRHKIWESIFCANRTQ